MTAPLSRKRRRHQWRQFKLLFEQMASCMEVRLELRRYFRNIGITP